MSTRADSPRWLKDGTANFSGGIDGSRPPSDIGSDQCAFATNATFRGGPAGPRSGFVRRPLTFAPGVEGPFSVPQGPFQHARPFDGAGVPCLMSSQGGRQFMINLLDFSVTEITPLKSDGVTLDINSPILPIGWSEQAENYWIYQDNQSYPIIFNGSVAVRSNPGKYQVPVGNVMCYTQGRLAVALPDRFSFRVGDIVFGSSGTAAQNYRDAMLYFTENNYYNEGGDFVARVFGAPSNVGPIMSMKAGAMTDTALGQGPLIVGTPYMVFTVQLPFDRTIWKNLAQALVTANPIIGPLGQDSTVLVNTDLWYRGIDGIRSYMTAQRQFNGSFGNTPMSAEIDHTLAYDTPELLEWGSGVLFDNRILMTVSPVNSPYGVWHRGLAVIDLDLISNLRVKTAPAWEGIWSGPKILKIVKIMVNMKERCFLYCLNAANRIELIEMLPGARFDYGHEQIPWTLETRSYACGNIDQFKRLETGRIIVSDLAGDFSSDIQYRTDENACWQDWDSIDLCAKDQDCGPAECAGPHTYREQQRCPVRLHMPPDDFDPISSKKYRTGYEFQVKFTNLGAGNIKQFRVYALDEVESINAERSQT